MSSRAARLLGVLLSITLPSLLPAQTLPTTTPATQPSIQCSPEVQALIPLIREGERLYTDIEVSYTFTDRGVGQAPNQTYEHVSTATWIHSKSRFYSEVVQSWNLGQPNASETRTVVSWDGQFHRIFMEDLIKDDRAAMISLRIAFHLYSDQRDMSPFLPVLHRCHVPLAEHFVFGASREALGSQQITRLPDADWHNRRCVRLQIVEDTPARPASVQQPVRCPWRLLANAHYLPVKMEALIRNGEQQGLWLVEAAMLPAGNWHPGIFHPTQVTQSLGDANHAWSGLWRSDHVTRPSDTPRPQARPHEDPHPTRHAPDRPQRQQATRPSQNDTHWTLRSAAAFLLDPTTTTQPAR